MAKAKGIHSRVAAACYDASLVAGQEAERYRKSAGENRRAEQCHTENSNTAFSEAKRCSELLEPHLTAEAKHRNSLCMCTSVEACRNARSKITKNLRQLGETLRERENHMAYAEREAGEAHTRRVNREWDVKQSRFFHELAFNMSAHGSHHQQIANTYATELKDQSHTPPAAEQVRRLSHSVQDAIRHFHASSRVRATIQQRADSFGQHHIIHPRHDHRNPPPPDPNRSWLARHNHGRDNRWSPY
jgi:N-methylhydantoinase A/oxoprolinase/acetone carboxylase beta subunit